MATTGLINGGMDPSALAQQYGLPATGKAGGPVTYSFEQPNAGWQTDGSYVGMPLQSNTNSTGLGKVDTGQGQAGYVPNGTSNVDPSIGGRFSLASGITQNNGGNNSLLVDPKGAGVASWSAGANTSGQPSSINAGYSWQNGKIVADPTSNGYTTDASGNLIPMNASGANSARAGQAGPSGQSSPFGSTNPTASTFDAVTRGVDPNELTSNRLNGLIASNSPYIQQARSGAMITANDRGLINSSMAAGAGEAAAINAALPIANADASTTGGVLTGNMNARNQVGMQGAQLGTQAAIAGAGNAAQLQTTGMNDATQIKTTGMNNQTQLGVAGINANAQIQTTGMNNATQLGVTGMNNATQLQNTALNNATALAQTTLSTQAQTAIAQMGNATQMQINTDLNANRVLLQNSQAAVNLGNQYALNVANIDASTTMDMAAKQAAIQSQRDIFNQSIAALTKASPGIPDLSSTLTFK